MRPAASSATSAGFSGRSTTCPRPARGMPRDHAEQRPTAMAPASRCVSAMFAPARQEVGHHAGRRLRAVSAPGAAADCCIAQPYTGQGAPAQRPLRTSCTRQMAGARPFPSAASGLLPSTRPVKLKLDLHHLVSASLGRLRCVRALLVDKRCRLDSRRKSPLDNLKARNFDQFLRNP